MQIYAHVNGLRSIGFRCKFKQYICKSIYNKYQNKIVKIIFQNLQQQYELEFIEQEDKNIFVDWFLFITLFCTVLLIIMTYFTYISKNEFLISTKSQGPQTTIFNTGEWKTMILEMFIYTIIPLPLTKSIKIDFYIEFYQVSTYYQLNEILTFIMLLRVIIMVKQFFKLHDGVVKSQQNMQYVCYRNEQFVYNKSFNEKITFKNIFILLYFFSIYIQFWGQGMRKTYSQKQRSINLSRLQLFYYSYVDGFDYYSFSGVWRQISSYQFGEVYSYFGYYFRNFYAFNISQQSNKYINYEQFRKKICKYIKEITYKIKCERNRRKACFFNRFVQNQNQKRRKYQYFLNKTIKKKY
ncbi:hypothetical protein IMG5_195500 [Ichthyophthirius multifiliis]|uniref:Transmembrane protein n=1 Tax=Ichthyophthirius multifiliis TaxID=5932 RepID=G0R4Y5_ICHMU|nr:hypothetical protein IMG5_195500 [Ichthyophthirius multifiliis]EGR27469.1 hypothetical protein IMG5_195500 [Ichthyophthirius multifiliis]|eukprot:XP_004024379.1 hypothetical protein IMG5_195500 [Ichthyophthirius multifiliis]